MDTMNLFKPPKTLSNGSQQTESAYHTVDNLADQTEAFAERAADQSIHMIRETRDATDNALDALSGGVESLAHRAPEMGRRLEAKVESLAQRGIDQVRGTGAQVRDRVSVAGDRTLTRIQDEPVKAVLIAAAAGAVFAVLLGMWNSRRQNRV
jgi:ElaB/YqjD/DUF883 family membrane-anchored ribosome-binding protein